MLTFRGQKLWACAVATIHGYDQVDFDILWQIVAQDVPVLIAALEKVVPRADSD